MTNKDMNKKTEIELFSEKMGIVFSSAEEIPNEEPEEVIVYDEFGAE